MKQLLWYTVGGVAYHASAKCGSQSLLKGILAWHDIDDPGFGQRRATVHYELVKPGYVMADVVPMAYHRIQFVREPTSRFESLWRWGCDNFNQGIPAALWGESPDALLWHIEDYLYDNEHWCPQSVVTPHASELCDLDLMSNYLPIGEKENTTSGEVPLYDEMFMRQLYHMDFLLFNETEKSPL